MSSPFLIFSPLLPIRHFLTENFEKLFFQKISTISTWKRSSKRGGHFQQSNQLLAKVLAGVTGSFSCQYNPSSCKISCKKILEFFLNETVFMQLFFSFPVIAQTSSRKS